MSQKKNHKYWLAALLLGVSLLCGCSVSQPEISAVDDIENKSKEDLNQVADAVKADVVSVQVMGNPNAYQFSVGIASPDKGCEQYADWWEVLTEKGELVYRRILDHSHVDEQPFVRSGGPVDIRVDTVVIIRAHMNSGGYGGKGMKGTVPSGFAEVELLPGFAKDVESAPPQPTDCAF